MADFTAVLRKTIDGLGETTPETRARVYDKARATISAKLAAMNPAPAPAVVERQRKVLEDAIASLEAEYTTPPSAEMVPEEDLDDIMAQLSKPEGLKPAPAPVMEQPVAPAKPDPAAPRRDPAPLAGGTTTPEGLRPATAAPREVSLPGSVSSALRRMVMRNWMSLPGIVASPRIAGSGGRSLPGDSCTRDQTMLPCSAVCWSALVRSS